MRFFFVFSFYFLFTVSYSKADTLREEDIFQTFSDSVSLASSNIPVDQFQRGLRDALAPYFTKKGLNDILDAREKSGISDVHIVYYPVCVLSASTDKGRYKAEFLINTISSPKRYANVMVYFALDADQYKIDQMIAYNGKSEDVSKCPAERMAKKEYIGLKSQYNRLFRELEIVKEKIHEIEEQYPEYIGELR